MRKVYFFLFLTICSNSNLFGWDTTAAKLYPLQVGNIYVYTEQQLWGQGCIPTVINGRRLTKIVGDTIFNGKQYFVFSGWLYRPWWKFQRVDSNSMNVYIFNTSDSQEYLFDSLLAEVGDSLKGSRGTLIYPRAVIMNIATYNFLGQMRKTVSIDPWEGFPSISSYQLTEGIGFSSWYGCELGGVRYYLNGCVINGITYGDTTLTSLTPISASIPDKFFLHQNFPNPFNPSTNIKFDIPKSSFVELKIFDISGKEIAKLVSQDLNAGSYNYNWDAGNLSSGVYFYRLTTGDFISTRKMIFLK